MKNITQLSCWGFWCAKEAGFKGPLLSNSRQSCTDTQHKVM